MLEAVRYPLRRTLPEWGVRAPWPYAGALEAREARRLRPRALVRAGRELRVSWRGGISTGMAVTWAVRRCFGLCDPARLVDVAPPSPSPPRSGHCGSTAGGARSGSDARCPSGGGVSPSYTPSESRSALRSIVRVAMVRESLVGRPPARAVTARVHSSSSIPDRLSSVSGVAEPARSPQNDAEIPR